MCAMKNQNKHCDSFHLFNIYQFSKKKKHHIRRRRRKTKELNYQPKHPFIFSTDHFLKEYY